MKTAGRKYTAAVVISHVIIICLAYSSPFWLDWRLILLGIILNYIQLLIFNGCVLSLAQFEDKGQTFHEWYLRKLGFNPNRQKLVFVLRWIVPFIILATAIIYQVLIGVHVLISF